ncbi:MAG: hypothetical protein ACRDKJ_13495 [Actinomycetota bacterium]
MEIRIALESTDPPSGRVLRGEGGRPSGSRDPGQPFTGWLDLMRALYELLPSAVDDRLPT